MKRRFGSPAWVVRRTFCLAIGLFCMGLIVWESVFGPRDALAAANISQAYMVLGAVFAAFTGAATWADIKAPPKTKEGP